MKVNSSEDLGKRRVGLVLMLKTRTGLPTNVCPFDVPEEVSGSLLFANIPNQG